MLDAGDDFLNRGAELTAYLVITVDCPLVGHVHPDQVDSVTIRNLVIPIQLVFDPKEDEGGAGDAEGKAGHIEDAVDRAFAPATDGSGQIVP